MQKDDSKYFDVVICGGGPAGSTAALALAGHGLRVAVIEKGIFPRDKVCGDAVATYVPKVLRTIRPEYADMLAQFTDKTVVNTCRMFAPNQKHIDFRFSGDAFIATRMRWDNFLYQLAAAQEGVSFFLDHPIAAVKRDSEKGLMTVHTDKGNFHSKLVIGCDGAHSVVAKHLTGTRPDLRHYAGAVRAYYKNVAGFLPNTFELHFLKQLDVGYFWIFPLPNNMANVGLGGWSAAIAKRKINLRERMLDIIHNTPSLSARFAQAELVGKIEGFGLPLGSRKVPISGAGFMLCGDAAALIDPATGEGIGQAMISGRYAGWQALACFEKNDFSAAMMQRYDQTVYTKLWRAHRRSHTIQRILLGRYWLLDGIFNIASRSTYIQRLLKKAVA